jgi:vancomycin resistance protein VanJ
MNMDVLSRRPRWLLYLSLLYLAVVLGLWALLAAAADRWWLGTVILFSPRWIWGLPLVILVPAALWRQRRSLWLLVPAALIVTGPLMGLCLSWQATADEAPAGRKLRVLSCNVHYKALDKLTLGPLLAETRPDVVALQAALFREWAATFDPGEWHTERKGEFLLASRFPIGEVEAFPDTESPCRQAIVRYRLETPAGDVEFFNLHLATPREGLEAVINGLWEGADELQANSDLRRRQSAAARQWVSLFPGPVLIAGDFNTPPDSTVYREYWSDFTNAFSQAGCGWGNTHFTRRTGVRIDHQLAGPGWTCRRCWVGPDIGSEHRPVIADWEWE